MPPPPPKQEEDEEKQQAVLLADSFTDSFRPLSYEMPKVLCPVVNVPMIDYVMELLASNGVEEVIVFCVNHAEELAKYISQSKWSNHMDVRCITSGNCLSAGDALRELDQMGIVRCDPFVLISGDVISNIDIRGVIRAHREAKAKDQSKIMTMCFKEANAAGSSMRPVLEDLVVGLDADTQQVLLFDNNMESRNVVIPSTLLSDQVTGANVDLRCDLHDCGIDVCSPEVLMLMSDNFDYQDLRQHFVANEVANVELGNKIMAHVVGKREYCTKISDFRLYAAASFDIMRRWSYPIVPDNPPSAFIDPTLEPISYQFVRGCIYRHRNLTLPRSVHLGMCSTVGNNVTVGENAFIEGSVLGPEVSVGSGARVVNSYVWSGGKVEQGASVEGSVIGQGAVVGEGAHISRGCVLGRGVIVGKGVKVPPFTRLTCVSLSSVGADADWGSGSDEDGDQQMEDQRDPVDVAIVGKDGRGRVWRMGEESNDDEEEEEEEDGSLSSGAPSKLHCQSIGCADEESWKLGRWATYEEEEEQLFDEDDEGEFFVSRPGERASISGDIMGDAPVASNAAPSRSAPPQNSAFHKVIKDLLLNGHAEGHQTENLLLEIKGYKFAQNNSFAACIAPAVEAVLEIAESQGASGMDLVASIRKQLQEWKALLSSLVQEVEYPRLVCHLPCSLSRLQFSDQVAMICALERGAVTSDKIAPIFRFALQLLYDMELVTEDAVLDWAEMRRSGEGGLSEIALFNNPKMQEFIEWLEEEDEEDDGDSEDEDEDSDE
jgi:translation initiation factor eIF-2B subunit epsilon